MPAEPRAVLWDFDGTLVDTEPLWAATERVMLAEYGVEWGEDEMLACHGQHALLTAQMMADDMGIPDRAAEVWRELHERIAGHIRSNDLPWLPGARELMAELDDAGVPCAIVTASDRIILDAARERLPRNLEVIVTVDEVSRAKPHPEGYLTAARRLGVDPRDAVALEDSVPGTTAALAAGAVVYAVPTMVSLDPHPRMHVSATGLSATSWADLTAIWRELKEN
ncbi:hypothetical protein BCR15_03200 [Tessaracoccus lapidicaptus]|jgi:HAD superfamily hydrolase (TIGR01509 family)|uniref:Uncharacterized protein n=1 Tax=Tessaracoccus lapidicaptus TaxID=1427523 RepID=A0A1C0AN12_9ACTN|nr:MULTISPECIES: HAD family phosphatase [Tessaracoccus]OCL34706.1 hypothetical protein BCR15_03200 [Tessaracoccus lapidicaptus]VEP38689.1 Phosphorylated carbohydrates phosphatase [Tessaracoccus lapidicaptus]